jgi:SAM-dependent methyltransferase
MTTPPRPALALALVSGLVLFLELTLIRWLPAHVLYLTFFTNTVLLAAFVGMCLGCLAASQPTRHILRTPLWLAITVVSALTLQSFDGLVQFVDVAGQANPDVVFFGTEHAANRQLEFPVPVELFMAAFFILAAMCLVGPGQEMGRAFAAVPNRTTAYSANLAGSLVGIAAFAVISELQLPPVVWYGLVALGVATLIAKVHDSSSKLPHYAFLLLVVVASVKTSGWVRITTNEPVIAWSPYYRVDFNQARREVATNQISHQTIAGLSDRAIEAYAIPHLFRRDVKTDNGQPAWPGFKRILIIGSGTGNDLSRACQWAPKDARIDAVEIDPAIQALGRAEHPDKPYSDPRVNAVLNDGRNFLRRAPDAEYDLVIFALVDSLVLHSGYSNLRLESFLFTLDSFKDVRRVLKPSGVCAVYNFFRQGWIAVRLRDELRTAFGGDPVVFTDPPLAKLQMDQFDSTQFTAFFAGTPAVVDPLRNSFKRGGNNYWFPGDRAIQPDTPAVFQKDRPEPLPTTQAKDATYVRESKPWMRLTIAEVDEPAMDLKPATDDWPFLYSRRPGIPGLTWRGAAIVLALSLALWALLVGRGPLAGSGETGLMLRSFLLGAGFMLVETKSVVHMALLFGSTWMVNTFVFVAVLLMSLAGNLFAGWVKPRNLAPYYIGLMAALAMNVLVPLDAFLGLDRMVQIAASCALAFLPIAFAGVIFATTFAQSKFPDRIFGANIAGALIGGLTENASMLLGFRNLLLVAVAFYLLSALCRTKQD